MTLRNRTNAHGCEQSQTQDQIIRSILKMNAQAEAAMAVMLLQNACQIQAMSHSGSCGVIDLFA